MYDKIIIVKYKKKLNLFRHFGKNLIFCSRHFGDINSRHFGSRHFGHGPNFIYKNNIKNNFTLLWEKFKRKFKSVNLNLL